MSCPTCAQTVLSRLPGHTHTDTSAGENMSKQSQLIYEVEITFLICSLEVSFVSLTAI